MRANEFLVEEDRVRARVADAAQGRDRSQAPDQRRETRRAGWIRPAAAQVVAAIRVDRLAEQHDLEHAARRQHLRLPHDRVGGPAHLTPARGRHDAERAEHVAAFHHREVGAPRRRLDEGGVAIGEIEAIEARRGRDPGGPLPHLGSADHRGHEAQVVGPEYEVHMAEAREQRIALLLGHAAADPEQPARAQSLPFAEASEVAVEAVRGLLPDRAGVDHQEIGALLLAWGLVARVEEQVGDLVRVVGVHLAPEGADCEGSDGHAQGNLEEPGTACQAARAQLWLRFRLASSRLRRGFASNAKSCLTAGYDRGHNAEHQVAARTNRRAAAGATTEFRRFWSGGG